MRKFLSLLLALILLFGCRSKKINRTELKEEQKTERKELKDSTTHIEKAQKVSTFEIQQSELYEITLESDKDSIGNAKDVIYYRARDGDSETIRVQGGKVTIKTIENHSKSLQQADSALYNNSYTRTKAEVQKHAYTQVKQVSKQVKSSPVRHTLWLLLLALLVYIFWKYKPFRWK